MARFGARSTPWVMVRLRIFSFGINGWGSLLKRPFLKSFTRYSLAQVFTLVKKGATCYQPPFRGCREKCRRHEMFIDEKRRGLKCSSELSEMLSISLNSEEKKTGVRANYKHFSRYAAVYLTDCY